MELAFEDLWQTRATALAEMQGILKAEAGITARIFTLIDECLEDYQKFFLGKTPLATVSSVVTLKGRNLVLGCLTLMLDGLGQECGALFRLVLEAIELLRYVRVFPGAVDEALEDRLPKAGEIAKRIDGKFKDLRDYLNEHASHVAISFPAMRHLVDSSTGQLRIVQPHQASVLSANLSTLFMFASMLALESAATLAQCTYLTGEAPVTTESLVNKIHVCRNEALHLFFPEEASAKKAGLVGLPLSGEPEI